jgi:undecaprenyl diphosphate synthase
LKKETKDNLVGGEGLRSVAIIMDGNGRWAKKRLLPRTAGHKKGAAIIENILTIFREKGINYVTLYAFSTENWKRPKEEVDTIMNLVYKYLDEVVKKRIEEDKDFSMRFLGDKNQLPEKLRDKCIEIENMAKDRKFVCNLALNYGGRDDIVHAAKEVSALGLPMTEENISNHLYTAGTPDPDLLIRTGGDLRISNFLLWQVAYSEIVVIDTLWPDFSRKDIDFCIKEFYSRKRRFGGLNKEDDDK